MEGRPDRTIINLTVPALELSRADTVRLGDRVTLVARGDLVETITVVYNPRHGRGVAGRGLGGGGGGGCG
jgi:pyruvate/2-oxoglutarate/acetoin dehydrogenase E1 component